MDRKPTLIVYGATAFTARQLLTYLDQHPEGSQFEFIIAGRNKEKLDKLNDELHTKREVIACELSDEHSVEVMMARGDAVVNVAGPYRSHNAETLIRVCSKVGKHYFDLTGESAWLEVDIIPKYHSVASSTGACIVPSCGFDSVPSDIIVYLADKTVRSVNPQLRVADSTTIFKAKATIAGGTVQSFASLADLPKDKRRAGEFTLCPVSLPSTPPFLSASIAETSLSSKLCGAFFFMYPYNRIIVRRSQYLAGLLPSDGKDLMSYKEALDLGKGPVASSLISVGMGVMFGLFLGVKFVRNMILKMLPGPGEGASLETLKAGYWQATNLSVSGTPASGGEPVKVLTKIKADGDPGYLSTCYMLAESALSLILPAPENTSLPPLAKTGGLLTPATALGDVLLERLRRSGKFEISSEVLPSGKKDI